MGWKEDLELHQTEVHPPGLFQQNERILPPRQEYIWQPARLAFIPPAGRHFLNKESFTKEERAEFRMERRKGG